MDSVFLLADGDRAFYLRSILIQTFAGTYICLWEYNPQPLNCLVYKDGFFGGDNNQASSSMGNSGAHRLFNEYTKTPIPIDVNDDRIPGLALKNNRPYLELGELDLLTKASTDMQRQFYQEVRIKTAVFMGCNLGEIEIGFSSLPKADIQRALMNLFPDDFSKLSQPVEQYPPSSSSSSLRSFSTMDSPEYSSLLFNIPTTTQIPTALGLQQMPTTTSSPTQQAIHTFAELRNIQFPSLQTEEAVMTRALLAVFSSSSSSTSTSQPIPPFQSLPNYNTQRVTSEASAFKNYRQGLRRRASVVRSTIGGQSMMKRSIAFFRNLNLRRLQERMQSSRYNTTQLHHMISERRRREKLNVNFRALRELLPPGTKKDKASILTSAKETLSALMAQIEELSKRNEQLETQVMPASSREAKKEAETSSSNERLVVGISHVAESTSEARFIDLQVTVRARCPQVDLMICLLEFLKQDQNVNLISFDANTRIQDSTPVNNVTLRLSIEGSDWDESAFQEAIRRVVSDLAQ